MSAFTEDRFLDGRVLVRQPISGFRSGLDAVMLAASIPATAGNSMLELGSGAGVASLCLTARVPGCDITGLEIDPELVALANDNAAANAMATRVRFECGDVHDLPRDLRRQFDHVICNPPFHGEDGEASPDAARARALQDIGSLAAWLRVGVKRTAPNGTFTLVLRADRLAEVLAALPERGVSIFPLWPKQAIAAKRVLIQVRVGNGAPLALLPGLVLHEPNGNYTQKADAILRGLTGISLAPD